MLHIKIVHLLRKEGFTITGRRIFDIALDRKSLQWWTRNLPFFLFAAGLQVFFGYQGPYIEPTEYHVRIKL